MDRGAKCWVTILSQRIDPMLLQEIFQTQFSNNNKENLPARGGTLKTHVTQTGSSRIFKRMIPVD